MLTPATANADVSTVPSHGTYGTVAAAGQLLGEEAARNAAAGLRWVAEPVALTTEEAAISLEAEMFSTFAATFAAAPGGDIESVGITGVSAIAAAVESRLAEAELAASAKALSERGAERSSQTAAAPAGRPGNHHDKNRLQVTSRNLDHGRLQNMTGKQPFEAIVSAHGSTVLRVCRAVLGPADADDAWSETFLSAMKAYPDLPAGANVEAWLVTIAHRKAIDVTRAAARRAIPVAETPDTATSPAAGDAEPDAAAELTQALAKLPAKQKQAVAYHYLAGMPYALIGPILGNSEAAARRAAADGIRALRAAYREGAFR